MRALRSRNAIDRAEPLALSSSVVECIVPYVAGGGSDNRVRLLMRYFGRQVDRYVRVENVTDAINGHATIANAPRDGCTFGMISNEVGMMHWFGHTAVKPSDFSPLALVFSEPSGIVVRSDSALKSLQGLFDAIGKGMLTGSGGPTYGIWKFGFDGLLQAARQPAINVRWLPTISGEEGVEHVIAGRADFAPVALAEAASFLRLGAVKGLVTMAPSRSRHFPDVPTVDEAIGVRWDLSVWRGIAVPAGIPGELRHYLIDKLKCAAEDQQFRSEAEKLGYAVAPSYGDAFEHQMVTENARFGSVIKQHLARATART